MNKQKLLIATLSTLLLLNSCGIVADGLGGSNKKGSEEFLVKKKAPLVLPPSYGELPKPEAQIDKNAESIKKDTLSIEEMINQSSSIKKNKKKK